MPFHKLTGWTTYSLVEPIEKILGWRFDGLEDMTGLPEYRNGACVHHRAWGKLASCSRRFCGARSLMSFSFPPSPLLIFGYWYWYWRGCGWSSKGGLLVDLGVLSLKPLAIPASYYPPASSEIPRLPPSHPAIVEWRAMTVIEL